VNASAPVKPAVHRWTREEYLHLTDTGQFNGQRVELIDGKIIDMPAQKNAHLIAVEKTQEALKKAFGRKYWVRAQASLDLGPYSVPDPDVAVVPGPRRSDVDYPTEAVLVVEVSDTTLWYDRNRKSIIYATAGIAEYWILNLVDRQLEVHRNPVGDRARRNRRRYANVTVVRPGAAASPLAEPPTKVAVTALLP
jgi:Uma2 family endonuclease